MKRWEHEGFKWERRIDEPTPEDMKEVLRELRVTRLLLLIAVLIVLFTTDLFRWLR